MVRRMRLSQRALRVLIGLCLIAAVATAVALNLPGGDSNSAFGGDPLPTLFPDSQVRIVEGIVAPAQARALRDANRWLRTHPTRDDAAFENFALSSVGKPPTGVAQQRELALLHRIAASKTQAGVAAAAWLETHGKKDIWKLYRKQYQELVSPAAGDHAKKVLKDAYALANALATEGKADFARPSPYITDPSLHAANQSRFAKKFSYPAKHALISYALAGILTRFEPHRAGEYRWMADEIAYSRMYAGGHYPSDLAAGAYLGTLLEQYELRAAAVPAGKG